MGPRQFIYIAIVVVYTIKVSFQSYEENITNSYLHFGHNKPSKTIYIMIRPIFRSAALYKYSEALYTIHCRSNHTILTAPGIVKLLQTPTFIIYLELWANCWDSHLHLVLELLIVWLVTITLSVLVVKLHLQRLNHFSNSHIECDCHLGRESK